MGRGRKDPSGTLVKSGFTRQEPGRNKIGPVKTRRTLLTKGPSGGLLNALEFLSEKTQGYPLDW